MLLMYFTFKTLVQRKFTDHASYTTLIELNECCCPTSQSTTLIVLLLLAAVTQISYYFSVQ